MRIVGGEFRGRRFSPPSKNWKTRPTTDFAKEGLYNVLTNLISFEDQTVLDLFSGTGNHSYEFISRGCKQVTLVEKHRACLLFIQKVASELKIEDCLTLVRGDVFKFLKSTDSKFSFVFADPPYDHKLLDTLPDIILNGTVLDSEGIFVLEHDSRHRFEGSQFFWQERTYGNVHFSFFRKTT